MTGIEYLTGPNNKVRSMNNPTLPKAFWNPRQTRTRVVSKLREHLAGHIKGMSHHDVGLAHILKDRKRGK